MQLPTPDEALHLTAPLHTWYRAQRRILPWRDAPTPYRVWVSEVMLQQTQVATVLPFFERFIASFPDIVALAQAPESAVLAAWSGLGYYRRARALHAAAQEVVATFDGHLPHTVEELMTLPGIGRYTAGAIASIAFSVRTAALDGNVMRVLTRLFGLDAPIDQPATQRVLWALAERLVPPDASTHNQAMMELGALVCTPRAPACGECPLAEPCVARRRGDAETLPRKQGRTAVLPITAVAFAVTSPHHAADLLFGRRSAGLLGGLWELPTVEVSESSTQLSSDFSNNSISISKFETLLGVHITPPTPIGTLTHRFTHRHLTLHLVTASLVDTAPLSIAPTPTYSEFAWLPRVLPNSVPCATLTRKALKLLHAPRLI